MLMHLVMSCYKLDKPPRFGEKLTAIAATIERKGPVKCGILSGGVEVWRHKAQ